MSDAPRLEAGERLGDGYLIGGELARRGHAWLYEADDLILRRKVAVKVAAGDTGAASLRREALALAQLRHPGVPAVYTLGSQRGLAYMVHERTYGVTLAELTAERPGGFHAGEAIPVLTSLAEVIAAVHEHGGAHGALTPASVLATPSERVILLDYGVAEPALDARARDIAAFGRIAYEVLLGTPPGRAPEDIAAMRPDVPAPIAEILQACLSPGAVPMAVVAWELRGVPRRRSRRRESMFGEAAAR